ncbi:hypothetical protein IG631_16379 [Alternaria alternata]|nr:hypothetical protein IG631_16379 [Alternaria alternata]
MSATSPRTVSWQLRASAAVHSETYTIKRSHRPAIRTVWCIIYDRHRSSLTAFITPHRLPLAAYKKPRSALYALSSILNRPQGSAMNSSPSIWRGDDEDSLPYTRTYRRSKSRCRYQ